MNSIIRTVSTVAFLAVGVACGGAQQEPAVAGTGVTNAQSADSTVVQKLSTARCDREERCNNVGAGKRYASREVCMDQTRGNLANDLNVGECPKGIDEAQLDRCMNAVRNEECSHPLDTLARIDKCRTSAMCMK